MEACETCPPTEEKFYRRLSKGAAFQLHVPRELEASNHLWKGMNVRITQHGEQAILVEFLEE